VKHEGGMEIDTFEVRNARVSVLKEMGLVFMLASSLPPISMPDVEWDVCVAWTSGMTITCKLPSGTTPKHFVTTFCYHAANR
jgi:hypothetical protein